MTNILLFYNSETILEKLSVKSYWKWTKENWFDWLTQFKRGWLLETRHKCIHIYIHRYCYELCIIIIIIISMVCVNMTSYNNNYRVATVTPTVSRFALCCMDVFSFLIFSFFSLSFLYLRPPMTATWLEWQDRLGDTCRTSGCVV